MSHFRHFTIRCFLRPGSNVVRRTEPLAILAEILSLLERLVYSRPLAEMVR